MTLIPLAEGLEALAADLPKRANELAKQVATAVLNDLTQVTPTDTGTALSNWQTSVEAPHKIPIPAFEPSPKGRMRAGIWTHAVDPTLTAQNNAPIVLDIGRHVIQTKQPGQPLYIANVVPYIEELNSGSSIQAPAGFVDRAVILGRSIIAKFKVFG